MEVTTIYITREETGMKRGKSWLAILLAGMMAIQQVGVFAEELTDGATVEEVVVVDVVEETISDKAAEEGTVSEERIVDEIVMEDEETITGNQGDNLIDDKDEAKELKEVGSTSGKCGDNLTWALDDSGVLTISGIGEMYNMYQVEQKWDNLKIKKVIMKDGVTSIGEGAFSFTPYLSSVSIPSSVTSIGAEAFYECFSLKSITIPQNVASIGHNVFGISGFDFETSNRHSSMSEIIFLGNAPYLESSCFSNVVAIAYYPEEDDTWINMMNRTQDKESFLTWIPCKKDLMGNLILPNPAPDPYQFPTTGKCGDNLYWSIQDRVITISGSGEMDDGVFDWDEFQGVGRFWKGPLPWRGVTKAVLSEGVSSIGKGMFSFCLNLEVINLPKSLTNIDSHAFWRSALKEIYFRGNAPSFEYNCFWDVTATVYYPKNNPTWTESVKKDYGGTITWIGCDQDSSGNLIIPTIPTTRPTITASYNSSKGGDVRWKKVDGADGYVLYRNRSADGLKKVATIKDPNVLSFIDNGIKDNCWGRVYTYYVRPLFSGQEGTKSDSLTLQRLAPMKITGRSNNAAGKVALNWACTVKENKALGYEIQYATSTSDLYNQKGSFKKVAVEGRSSLSRTLSGLTKGKTYYFRIRCYVNYTHSVTKKTTKTWSQYSDVVSLKISR